ncbi:MAG: ATP-binding protein [Aggregatilineales bacterium]
MNKTITLSATLKDVSAFVADLEKTLADLPIEIRTGITLSIQELGVNIVKHAYAGESGDIHVALDWSADAVRFVITDSATNAFTMPEIINTPDPLALQEHGMGLFIIHQSFDEVGYQRAGGQNRWTLEKFL